MSTPDLLTLTIAHREALTGDTELFRLVAPTGKTLPSFTPGAHITVQTPRGAMRRYSLISDASDLSGYTIAVKREDSGRGGSLSLHRQGGVNERILVEPPVNEFELVKAPAYLFIAGGIGITPIRAMIQSLRQRGVTQWQLIYCTRSPQHTAFLDEFTDPALKENVTIHHDNANPDSAFDFWPMLENPDERHIYCCGPQPLMDDVADMTGHWPVKAIHTESFNPVEAIRGDDQAFTVRIAGRDEPLTVAADQTILDALRSAGYNLRSSCESGTCGTCKVAYRGGTIEHRDIFLMNDEHENHLMVCVSRVSDGEPELTLPS